MKHRFFTFSLFTIYMVFTTMFMVWQGIEISPQRYALVLLLAGLVIRRTREFMLDWIPFIFSLISYDFIRNFGDRLALKAHFLEPLGSELFLFQDVPARILQVAFFNPLNLAWYDYVATIMYFLHFIIPSIFAYLLWINSKSAFREFITGYLLVSYAAWVTYLLYPAAPPWLASEQGYIDGISKVMDFTLKTLPGGFNLPAVYHNLNPVAIGAIPSLHTAHILLVFLFAVRYFGHKALPLGLYVLAVWSSLIYLGQHYIIDVFAGILYTVFFYIVATEFLHEVDWEKLFFKVKRRLPLIGN